MIENRNEPNWEQVSLELDPLLAEELAFLLGEILPGGVVLEKHYGDLFLHELDGFQGPVRLYGYFPASKRQDIQSRITQVLEVSGKGALLDQMEFSPLEIRNWATVWQEHYHPIPIGKKLAVVPTWLENPFPKRIPIRMDPGMAFGSGTHTTTQICLALLEDTLTGSFTGEMIDMGCGSGILSIAAAKLGVRKVLGVDTDPDAVRISCENAKANGVSDQVSFREGSVKDILDQDGEVSLVVANIIAQILKDLFDQGLGNLVQPGGWIILSGILLEQLPGILSSLDEAGFTCQRQKTEGDWVGLIAVKAAAP